mmetsp:Transcript_63586/g.176857  ORF Transcript_63586/g.176857 Transcript_63586/m.176857 type:complete len:201 (+) Transcript_63586:736-1338(+)
MLAERRRRRHPGRQHHPPRWNLARKRVVEDVAWHLVRHADALARLLRQALDDWAGRQRHRHPVQYDGQHAQEAQDVDGVVVAPVAMLAGLPPICGEEHFLCFLLGNLDVLVPHKHVDGHLPGHEKVVIAGHLAYAAQHMHVVLVLLAKAGHDGFEILQVDASRLHILRPGARLVFHVRVGDAVYNSNADLSAQCMPEGVG